MHASLIFSWYYFQTYKVEMKEPGEMKTTKEEMESDDEGEMEKTKEDKGQTDEPKVKQVTFQQEEDHIAETPRKKPRKRMKGIIKQLKAQVRCLHVFKV